ncbi:hypothetical protein AB0L82_02250 [Nocardia sp. NPDC052001]|uniref:hypothetical protein n=1 Tax=Nocardia sp. NPDC052001 TaxID=3154853 RepID=UPI00342C5173
MSIIQYFVFLFVVQAHWTTPYSWIRNAISDLGAETCFHSESVEANASPRSRYSCGSSCAVRTF